jgi:hypothetical protein
MGIGKSALRQQPPNSTTPLQLNGWPVGGPKGLRRECITDDLPQLSLCFCPVGVGHLPKAFCNPFPSVAYQRGLQERGGGCGILQLWGPGGGRHFRRDGGRNEGRSVTRMVGA